MIWAKVPPNGKFRGQRFESPTILNRSAIFLTLSKKEKRSTSKNNSSKIFIDQMYRAFIALAANLSNRRDFKDFVIYLLSLIVHGPH